MNPVKSMIAMAHRHGAAVVVDGAQAVAHVEVNVQDLDCDFYAFSATRFSGHGHRHPLRQLRHLETMPPWRTGGDMIQTVTFEKTSYARAPLKFEAGTPNVGGAIGLAAALEWLDMDRPALALHESQLVDRCADHFRQFLACVSSDNRRIVWAQFRSCSRSLASRPSTWARGLILKASRFVQVIIAASP